MGNFQKNEIKEEEGVIKDDKSSNIFEETLNKNLNLLFLLLSYNLDKLKESCTKLIEKSLEIPAILDISALKDEIELEDYNKIILKLIKYKKKKYDNNLLNKINFIINSVLLEQKKISSNFYYYVN